MSDNAVELLRHALRAGVPLGEDEIAELLYRIESTVRAYDRAETGGASLAAQFLADDLARSLAELSFPDFPWPDRPIPERSSPLPPHVERIVDELRALQTLCADDDEIPDVRGPASLLFAPVVDAEGRAFDRLLPCPAPRGPA